MTGNGRLNVRVSSLDAHQHRAPQQKRIGLQMPDVASPTELPPCSDIIAVLSVQTFANRRMQEALRGTAQQLQTESNTDTEYLFHVVAESAF